MKKLLFVFLLSASSLSLSAQFTSSEAEAFSQAQSLLDKVSKQEYFDGMGYYHTIINQLFTESAVTIIEKSKGNAKGQKYGDEGEIIYSDIPWSKMKRYYFLPANQNDKLKELVIDFDADLKRVYRLSDPYITTSFSLF